MGVEGLGLMIYMTWVREQSCVCVYVCVYVMYVVVYVDVFVFVCMYICKYKY